MNLSVRDRKDRRYGDSLPVHRATTLHLSALNPMFLESGLIDPRTGSKVRGVFRGHIGKNGSGPTFEFDEYQLYQSGILNNANTKVFGEPNHHKSGDAKCNVFRGAAVGFNHLVTDRTGEWTAVVNAINSNPHIAAKAKVLKFGEATERDTQLYINPLDKSMTLKDRSDLLAAMAVTAIGRRNGIEINALEIEERSLLWQALVDALNQYGPDDQTGLAIGEATLPDVVNRLLNPTQNMAEAMRESQEYLRQLGRSMALGLLRLTETDLKGMFHRQTTAGIWQDTPLLVMDCQGASGEAAVLMITLINFFTRSQWSRENPAYRFHKIIHDEAWDLAAYPAFIDSTRESFKQGGKWGVGNTIIAHHMQNLYRSGSSDAVRDLISDSDVTICYKMDSAELEKSAGDLELNRSEVSLITDFEPGVALYKIGSRPGIVVRHEAWPEEKSFVETRGLMRGQRSPVESDLPRAVQ